MAAAGTADGMYREVVFVFGAGASRDFGLPLVGEFSERINRLHLGIGLSNHERVLDGFRRVRKWLQNPQRPPGSWFDPDNIEHLFCLWQMEQETGKRNAGEKLDSLVNTIAFTIERSHAWDAWKPPSPRVPRDRGYPMLLSGLLRLYGHNWAAIGRPGFSFITTNYDLAFEDAWDSELHQEEMKPVRERIQADWYESQYPTLSEGACKTIRMAIEEHGGVPVLTLARYGLLGRPNGHLRAYPPLLKLHGSINWGVCPSCGNTQEFPMGFDRRRHGPDVLDRLLGTACKWHPETQEIRDDESPSHFRYQPLLVPPTWSKSGQCATLRDVWRQAVMEIASAKRLVFVGYSMPDTDVHVRYLLGAGLAGRESVPPVMVVNYHDDQSNESATRLRYQRGLGITFDDEPYLYVNKTFSQAFEDIIGFLKRPAP